MAKIYHPIDPLNRFQCKTCGNVHPTPSLATLCKHKPR